LALRAAVRERSKATVSTRGRQGGKCQHWPHEVPRLGWLGVRRCVMNFFPSRHIARDTLNDLLISILVAVATVMAAGLLDRVWDAL
jgi:hypothetical protein